MSVLLVDLNNILYAIRHARIKTPKRVIDKEEFVDALLFKETLTSIFYHARLLKTKNIVICGDSSRVWRRDVFKKYKLKDDEDIYKEECRTAYENICNFFKNYTKCYVLNVKKAEADDIVAYITKNYDNEYVILSSDKDFIQLTSPKVKLYSHTQNSYRESDNVGYDLFLKCIRGDRSDKIPSAYPRVRETVLKAAWDDDLCMTNLMETVLKDGTKVGDNFDLNMKLIDLTMQPKEINDSIKNCIDSYVFGVYDEFKIFEFLGSINLGKTDSNFITNNTHYLRHKFML